MNTMNEKKFYVWKLADFLCQHGKRMAEDELAEHLNRNKVLTSYGAEYVGGPGTYRLISVTWHWLNDDLGLPDEAKKVAQAYVTPDGTYAYS